MSALPWPRNPRYLVHDDGTIVGPAGHPLTPLVRPDNGYLQVVIWGADRKQSSHRVHVIVCETFHGPRPAGMQAAHRNGVPADCRASNLRWATPTSNGADRARHGTALVGERNHRHKLTEDDVRAIRAAYAGGEQQRSIAARYGITHPNVGYIVRRETWRHVT